MQLIVGLYEVAPPLYRPSQLPSLSFFRRVDFSGHLAHKKMATSDVLPSNRIIIGSTDNHFAIDFGGDGTGNEGSRNSDTFHNLNVIITRTFEHAPQIALEPAA